MSRYTATCLILFTTENNFRVFLFASLDDVARALLLKKSNFFPWEVKPIVKEGEQKFTQLIVMKCSSAHSLQFTPFLQCQPY